MKKPELTATSVEKFLIEKFDSVSDLMQLSEGEESRAFSFDVGGRGYVLRVNSCADGFYKDRYVGTVAKLAMRQPFVLFKGL
ncbi:hypothetical protein KXB16_004805, partial [Salmonella enterica subsp. enterica serovar Infantis]|nr:hypothetical protein [Salmonella enterica subsp. enterica serovar Infantis]